MLSVNNVQIHTDKEVACISGSLVQFVDGSYCNVDTGEVYNAGSGYIQIGGQPPQAQNTDTVTDSKQFAARELLVRGVHANVRVEVGTDLDIRYQATGPADLVGRLNPRVEDDTLVIGPGRYGSGGVTVVDSVVRGVISTGRNVVSSGGQYNVFGSGVTSVSAGRRLVELTVWVPAGTPVDIDSVLGPATVGDTNGPLRLRLESSDATVGRVTGLQVKVSGSGNATVASANGPVELKISGSGKLRVAGGNLTSLQAKISGEGSISVGGVADEADLAISGVGSIWVAHVRTRPRRRVSGVGDILVDHVGP